MALKNGISHDLELNSCLAKIGYYRALSRVLYFGYDGYGDLDDTDIGVNATTTTAPTAAATGSGNGDTTTTTTTTKKSKKKKSHQNPPLNQTNSEKKDSEKKDKGLQPVAHHLVYALRDKFGLDRIGKIDLPRANDGQISPLPAKPFPSSSTPLFLGSSEKSGHASTNSAYDSILKEEKKEVGIIIGPLIMTAPDR